MQTKMTKKARESYRTETMFKHERRRKRTEATKNWVQPKVKTKNKTARDKNGMKMEKQFGF